MIMCCRPNEEEYFYCTSGRNNTPFTTTQLSSARGELTKYQKLNTFNYEYKLVKITDVEEVH